MEFNCMMDNDSGYVSHHQESNLDSSSENIDRIIRAFSLTEHNDLYLSEDALLEKPTPVVENPSNDIYISIGSIVNSSQESVKTEFSGFDDSDKSDVSTVISEIGSIVWDSKEWQFNRKCERKDDDSALENSLNLSSEHPPASCSKQERAQNKNQSVMKNVFNEGDKENIAPVSATPIKQYKNHLTSNQSPDLFSDEEEIIMKAKSPPVKNSNNNKIQDCYNIKDMKLLRKVQSCLSGVHPPPSFTTIQISVNEMLAKIKENPELFWTNPEKGEEKSLLISDKPDVINSKWPEILTARYHGLHYNRHKMSEDVEHLCSRYAERYVGAETQSSCTVFGANPGSSQKRKFSKPKWASKSPGRRLSHLARRRITFSSSNLQLSNSSAILGSRARQILVDAKKQSVLNKKSPRKTPSKSPFKIRRKTPSSSAKKKLAMRFREMSGEFENGAVPSTSSDHSILNFKRALFHSPKQDRNHSFSGIVSEKKPTKRALFSSPLKSSPQKSPYKLGKRKRTDADESNSSKLARGLSFDMRPSQSESRVLHNRTLNENIGRPTTSRPEELSDSHKKKLQWAVYESLRLQNISASHPQYKIFASVLARVTRKFLPNIRSEGRTTDKMFRIARYHSYAVVKGKSVDEIINEYMKNKMNKTQKPQGYVGIEEFQSKEIKSNSRENVLQDKANIIESIEKRKEVVGIKSKFLNENRIDRIRKVICFEDNNKQYFSTK